MFKVDNRNTRTKCQICSELTIKTPEWRYYWVEIYYFACSLEISLGTIEGQCPDPGPELKTVPLKKPNLKVWNVTGQTKNVAICFVLYERQYRGDSFLYKN